MKFHSASYSYVLRREVWNFHVTRFCIFPHKSFSGSLQALHFFLEYASFHAVHPLTVSFCCIFGAILVKAIFTGYLKFLKSFVLVAKTKF